MVSKLSTDKPVKLIRDFTGKTGNFYFANKVYMPGELPVSAYTTFYSVYADGQEEPSSKPAMQPVEPVRGDFKAINPNPVVKPTNETEVFINANKDTVVKPEITIVELPPININTATAEELALLKGVSDKNAKKVVELRTASPFIDLVDLDSRVSLAFGRSWSTVNPIF